MNSLDGAFIIRLSALKCAGLFIRLSGVALYDAVLLLLACAVLHFLRLSGDALILFPRLVLHSFSTLILEAALNSIEKCGKSNATAVLHFFSSIYLLWRSFFKLLYVVPHFGYCGSRSRFEGHIKV